MLHGKNISMTQACFLHLKERWKSAPWSETSPTPLVIYVFTSYLAHIKRSCLNILRHHSGVRSVQVSCWFWQTYCTSRCAIVELQKTWKALFPLLVTGNWTWKYLLGTNTMAWSHAFNICCRTRCSVHDTSATPTIHCVQICTMPTSCVQYLFC